MTEGREVSSEISRLVEIMARLRDPEGGCPWDLEQNFASIAPYTIEEAYEVADAIERADWPELEGELGDLLLQAVYHAQLGAEQGLFDLDSIARRVADKMVARHPHVFGTATVADAAAQTEAWEAVKARERGTKSGALDGVARGLPALMRAEKLQRRAARVGFDWPEVGEVRDKLAEELAEFDEATDAAHRAEEFGDLLFVMVNLGRHHGIDAEAALRAANAKFERRFKGVEAGLHAEGKTARDASLAEMEAHWQHVKADE